MTLMMPSLSTQMAAALQAPREDGPGDDDATWARVAAAFAHTVLPVVGPAPTEEASKPWRPGDACLTPATTGALPEGGSGGLNASEPSTLSVKFHSEQFGSMSLTVRRDPEGARIELGVEHLHGLHTLQLELQSLGDVLRAAGLNIASLRVTQHGGTALAEGRPSGKRLPLAFVGHNTTRQGTPERRRVKVVG